MIQSGIGAGEIVIPQNITLIIIPSLNPDGLSRTISLSGRWNGNNVDLNRNFDYNWKPTTQFHNTTESCGTTPFSEPETSALRDYVLAEKPDLTIFYHCCWGDGTTFANKKAKGAGTLLSNSSGYALEVGLSGYTGEGRDWFQSVGLPAIEQEFPGWTNTTEVDWEPNKKGLQDLLFWLNEQ